MGKWNNCTGPDQDYWHKLESPEQKVWLQEFLARYYRDARFLPQQLTETQYILAGRDASERNNSRTRSIDNNAARRQVDLESNNVSQYTYPQRTRNNIKQKETK